MEVIVVRKSLVYNLFRGRKQPTIYIYRGCNLFTKYHERPNRIVTSVVMVKFPQH